MMVICDCGKEFLSECDIHIVIPNQNYKLNCGCHYGRVIESLINRNNKLKEALEFYAVRGLAEVKYGERIDSRLAQRFYIGGEYARSVLDGMND